MRAAHCARLAERLRPLFGHDLAEQPAIVMQQLSAMARYDMRDRLRELQSVRTLVLSGGQDRVAPARFGRALAEAIPGAKYVELTDAAHGVPIHSPEVVNGYLAAHFATSQGYTPAIRAAVQEVPERMSFRELSSSLARSAALRRELMLSS